MKQCKKGLILLFIIFFVIQIHIPVFVYADNASSSATLITDTPTPTPSVSPTLTPSPTLDFVASNSAEVTTTATSSAISGENTIEKTPPSTLSATPVEDEDSLSPTPTPTQQPNQTLTTGDSVTTTEVKNAVNTTLTNATVSAQTVNLFVTQNGDLNLSDPFTIASTEVAQHPSDPVINVSVTNVNNYSYVSNSLTSLANTGQNGIQGDASADISTGNAYSLVSLLNTVNFTVINSTIHVITINIFGDLNGNIILPDMKISSNCHDCGISLNATNSAILTNSIDSSATTGENNILATSNGNSITTGNANSTVSNENIVNTNAVGVNLQYLLLNLLGNWDGKFLGWGNLPAENGGRSLALSDLTVGTPCTSCNNLTSASNTAIVNNDITSSANSGNNNIFAGKGSIKTGNAYSSVSLINFINSNFLNVNGFFGFINVFGNWKGNIGGQSAFVTPTPTPTPTTAPSEQTTTTNDTQIEDGGALSIEEYNNVGNYILPGDTVTFFMNGKNTGSGKVYGASINLTLYHNGVNAGGADFPLGDIPVAMKYKLSTGLVLSKNSAPGEYTAVATITGTTGPNNTPVSASATSKFTIWGPTSNSSIIPSPQNTLPNTPKIVLDAHTKAVPSNNNTLLLVLGLSLLDYLLLQGVRKQKELKQVWITNGSVKKYLKTLKLILL